MSVELVYEDAYVRLWCGDALEWLHDAVAPVGAHAIVTDPPYGDTSLAWDRPCDGWQDIAAGFSRQLWCFGSLRFHLAQRDQFEAAGWKLGQEVVWEKHNGSGFAADRFKRVHEIAVHWYQGDWRKLHREVPIEHGHPRQRATRRANGTPHTGQIGGDSYDSTSRLKRSVIFCPSEQGRAVHPTQKPLGILRPLIEYSAPAGGLVLDPFAGSGSTLLAARELGRKAEGCEINPDYCEAAIGRLSQMEMAA